MTLRGKRPQCFHGVVLFPEAENANFPGFCVHGAASLVNQQPSWNLPATGVPPRTGTGPMLLFLSDTNDDTPTLHPRSRYREVWSLQEAGPAPSRRRTGPRSPTPTRSPSDWTIRGQTQKTRGGWRKIMVSICIGRG